MQASGRWSLRNIYLYLVCLITLVMVIFATVNVVRSAVELLYPDPGFYSYPTKERPADPEVKAEFEKERRLARQSSQRQAVLGLVGSLSMLLVAGPVYVYHWRKIESELPSAPPATGS